MIIDFNNPEKPVIIGLDHGYQNIKTAHACFQAGVTRHINEPTFKNGLMFYEGIYYTIGEEHKEFIADKMNRPRLFHSDPGGRRVRAGLLRAADC